MWGPHCFWDWRTTPVKQSGGNAGWTSGQGSAAVQRSRQPIPCTTQPAVEDYIRRLICYVLPSSPSQFTGQSNWYFDLVSWWFSYLYRSTLPWSNCKYVQYTTGKSNMKPKPKKSRHLHWFREHFGPVRKDYQAFFLQIFRLLHYMLVISSHVIPRYSCSNKCYSVQTFQSSTQAPVSAMSAVEIQVRRVMEFNNIYSSSEESVHKLDKAIHVKIYKVHRWQQLITTFRPLLTLVSR